MEPRKTRTEETGDFEGGPWRSWRIALAAVALLVSVSSGAEAQGKRFDHLHQMLPVDTDRTETLVLGDVDGDGDADLVVGNTGGNRLYLNDGGGLFTDATTTHMPADSEETCALALGDVDADGDLDLVIGNNNQQNRLYLNDGSGLFIDATSIHLPADSDTTQALALGDVDGDGDLDLVIGNALMQDRLYLNDGGGFFNDTTTALMPVDAEGTLALALGDVDGDGDLDLALGAAGSPNRLYFNDGAGLFTDATTTHMPARSCNTRALAMGDVDGDGDYDLVFGGWGGGCGWYGCHYLPEQHLLYLNDGAGHFSDETATHMPVDSDMTSALTLVDVDVDGDLDLVIGNQFEDFVAQNRLYLNDGTGHFGDTTATHVPADSEPTSALAAGDVDGDGDPDLVVGRWGWGDWWEEDGAQNRLYLNDGTGAFSDATAAHTPAGEDATTCLAFEDLDGDGDLDLVIGNLAYGSSGGVPEQQNRIYLNDGTGGFSDVTATHLAEVSEHTMALALGDVDGDGDPDLFLGSDQTRLYLNDGLGVFSDATAAHMPVDSGSRVLAVGDVDGDGDRDLVTDSLLYLNDGTGVFTDATTSHLPSGYGGRTLAMGDVDGDGDLDLLVGGHGGQQNRLYMNDGSGVFVDVTATHMPIDSDWTQSLALGDMDGDGDLDLVIGNDGSTGAQNRLYLNEGAGVLVDATTTHMPVDDLGRTLSLALGDVNGDEDLDLVIGNLGSENRLYHNDGTGHFSDATATNLQAGSVQTLAVALGDVDGDGDPDLVIGNFLEQNRILTNLTRDLAWRAIPRVGKPLVMDIYGSPGGVWRLAWALDFAEIPLPPWGILRLDPATLQEAGSGVLDGNGFSSVSWSVPNDAALVGVSFHLQAAIGSPLRLSNREVATFSDL